jgi:hypothetical protein
VLFTVILSLFVGSQVPFPAPIGKNLAEWRQTGKLCPKTSPLFALPYVRSWSKSATMVKITAARKNFSGSFLATL